MPALLDPDNQLASICSREPLPVTGCGRRQRTADRAGRSTRRSSHSRTGSDQLAETNTRDASCSCGQIRVVVEGDPVRVSICHCCACQKRTGSAFGVQARWPKDRATIEGKSQTWRRIGDDGTTLEFHFCPNCGSTVWYTQDVAPELIAIAVGAFGDPTFPAPTRSNYDHCRHAWVRLPDAVEGSR